MIALGFLISVRINYRICHYIIKIVEKKSVGLRVKREYKEFIAHFYSVAFIGIILEWFRSGMKEDPQKMVNKVSILVHGDFKRALDRYAE